VELLIAAGYLEEKDIEDWQAQQRRSGAA
jgi:hypothetical protein